MRLESLFTLVRTVDAALPAQEALDRVQTALTGDRNWRFTPIQTSENTLSFSVWSRRFSRFTSFCPEVTVQFDASDEGTTVRTVYRSREQIRIMLPLVTVLFLILEIYNLILWSNGNMPGIAAFLLPILLVALLCSLTCLGLRLPAKDITDIIQNACRNE